MYIKSGLKKVLEVSGSSELYLPLKRFSCSKSLSKYRFLTTRLWLNGLLRPFLRKKAQVHLRRIRLALIRVRRFY